jgi:hypothetical protein
LKVAILFVALLCLIPYQPAESSEVNEFPIGLRLEYKTVQQLDFNTIPISSDKYVVTDWVDLGSIVAITITESDGEHFVHVHLSDWHATYENGSEYGYLKPLWMDISSWKIDDNVSLGSKGVFWILDSRNVETDAGTFQVWTARSESSVGSHHLFEHYYYNRVHGVLIKQWDSIWNDTSVSEVTMDLVASNLENYDSIYSSSIVSSPLDLLLLGGIFIEIFTIVYILQKRR